MSISSFIAIAALAFFCEFLGLSLGMGYGMIIVPVLLMIGFEPLEIVPIVLLSEFISGMIAAVLHHKFKNVDFKPGTQDFKIVTTLIACSIIGAVIAVLVAINVSQMVIKALIGCIIVLVGFAVLVMRNRSIPFSWPRLVLFGLAGAFNKGITGGGYGPLVTGGQVLSGVDGRNAVGTTTLAKAVACGMSVVVYFLFGDGIDVFLAPPLILGAVLSAPFAAASTKKITQKKIKLFIGILTVVLGATILIRVFL